MTGTPVLRVAIVGAGPSGFFAAEHLRKQHPALEVDLFDRLPTPYGLVRGGVAPDHPKIKAVTRVFDRIAADPAVRFLGNVTIGEDLTRDDLHRHYHAVIYAVGSDTDRHLESRGRPAGQSCGHGLRRWHNVTLTMPIALRPSAERAPSSACARRHRRGPILARTPEQPETTDITCRRWPSGSRVRRSG
jgi:ferredoxin--NADP+ reductase